MELGTSSGFKFFLQDRNNNGHAALLAARNKLLGQMRSSKMFNAQNTRTGGLEDAPQLKIDINRAAERSLGLINASFFHHIVCDFW